MGLSYKQLSTTTGNPTFTSPSITAAMPASKRKSSNPRAAQATLAFGARSNKITKPIAPSPPSSKKLSKPQTEELVKAAEEGIPPAKVSVPEDASLAEGREEAAQRLAIRQAQTQEVRSEAEEKASKISEAAVKKYWRQKEEERKAPRGDILPLS